MQNEVITYLKSNFILINLQFDNLSKIPKAHKAQRPTPFIQTLSSWLMNQVIYLKRLITVSFFQSCPIFSSHQQVIIYRHFSGSVLLGALLITKEKETMQKDVWR